MLTILCHVHMISSTALFFIVKIKLGRIPTGRVIFFGKTEYKLKPTMVLDCFIAIYSQNFDFKSIIIVVIITFDNIVPFSCPV